MGKCDLMLDGAKLGSVVWNNDGAQYNIYCACPFEDGFIYRVLLINSDNSEKMLGVMIPKFGKFVLQKNLPKSAESIYGNCLENIKSAEIIRTMPGEYNDGPLPFPLETFEEYSPHKGLDALYPAILNSGSRCHFHAGELYIASPIESGREFALTPIFCMVTPIEINKRQYGVVKFDEKFNAKTVNIKQKTRG